MTRTEAPDAEAAGLERIQLALDVETVLALARLAYSQARRAEAAMTKARAKDAAALATSNGRKAAVWRRTADLLGDAARARLRAVVPRPPGRLPALRQAQGDGTWSVQLVGGVVVYTDQPVTPGTWVHHAGHDHLVRSCREATR